MEARHSVESHLRAMEHDAMNAMAPFGEIATQSRATFEKSVTAMRNETIDLLNRLHDRNGEVLAECAQSRDLASLAAAQEEKWFTDFTRDWYRATVRINEAARHIIAESFETAGHTIRNHNGTSETAEKAMDEMPARTHDN